MAEKAGASGDTFAGAVWAALRGQRRAARSTERKDNSMATQLFQPPHGSPAWFHDMVQKVQRRGGQPSERIVLTPDLATELLRNNPDNRFIRVAKSQQIASDIRSGRWTFNGEAILISREGLLNDGQHRANAVVETNTPVETMITFGLDRASRTTVDQGASRCAGDYLSMESVANSTTVASIGRLLLAYERSDGKNLSATSYISAGEVVGRFMDDRQVAISSTFSSSMHRYSKRLAPPSIIGLAHCLMSRISGAEADAYMRQVCMGENIKKADPAFAVREGLMRERVTREEKLHIIMRGWNAFRQRRKLTLAKVVPPLPALV